MWWKRSPKFPAEPAAPEWRCRECNTVDEGTGVFCKSPDPDDPSICDMCSSVKRAIKRDRRKRQEDLAAMVAGGLQDTHYRGRQVPAEIAAQAMQIAKAIMESPRR